MTDPVADTGKIFTSLLLLLFRVGLVLFSLVQRLICFKKGHFTKALVESPPGIVLSGAGSFISFNEWCEIFGRINNVKCVFQIIPRKAMEEAMGPIYGLEIADMFEYFDKYGFDGGADVVFPWDMEVKVKYTTMEEYMKGEDWSSVL